ncbi:MAG: hypothetical protein AAB229_09080 [Candidatus Hydrogenedentota bacterium]
MEKPEFVWPEVEEVERTKLDDWFNDIKTPPLSIRDAMVLGMMLLHKPFKITYEEE